MTLTVPKAGSDAGRAPRVRVEASQTGDVVARFGEVAKQIGSAMETDYLSREAQRFQTDLTADMNDLRLQVSQIGDPDAADYAWQKGVEGLKDAYITGQTEDGRPRVSEKNIERFGLTFDELNNRNTFSLGKQTLAARQSQREADFIKYSQIATQQGAVSDPEMRATLLGQGYDKIDEMVAQGVIDAAEGERRKIGLTENVDNARAIDMVSNNPEAFLAASESGDFGGLPAAIQARYRVQAQGNIDRAAAAAHTAAEKVAKEQAAIVADRLEAIRDVRAGDMKSVDEAWLASDEAKASPDYPETMAALSLSNEEPMLAQKTPAQLEAMIAGEEARPVKHKYQTERVKVLRDLKETAQQGWEKDQVAYAQEVGLYVPDLPDFDPADPAAYGKALRGRQAAAQSRVAEGYVKRPVALSDAERAEIETRAKSDQPVADRLALAKSLSIGFGGEARTEAQRLNEDPVFGWVTSLVSKGLPDKTSREILAGQTKLDQKIVVTPSRKEAIVEFHKQTENNFTDLPAMTEAVLDAAIAHYAETYPGASETAINTPAFQRSVNLVLGATQGRNNDLTVGGIQRIDTDWLGKGYLLPLPPGIAAEDVETVIGTVETDLRNSDMTRLQAASIAGILPDFEGSDPADIWQDSELVPFWPEGDHAPIYVLQRTRNGRPTYLAGEDGSVFKLDLQKLISGVTQ